MRLPLWIACGVATAALTAGTGAVQRDAPTVRIAAPTDDTYVSGPTRLVVVVEPALVAEQHQGLRELYVALTRPTRTLVVLHARPLPRELKPH